MDKEVETVFFKMRSLNKAVKEYFVSRGLTSVAAINEFPATDLQLLKEQFNDCPEIKKLAVRHEILCFFNELKNSGAKPVSKDVNIRRSISMKEGPSTSSHAANNRLTWPEIPSNKEKPTKKDHHLSPKIKKPSKDNAALPRAVRMRDSSNLTNPGGYLYELPKDKVAEEWDDNMGFRRLIIGRNQTASIGEKVILIVGGTGSGKSTFINALANYLYEVDFNDPFRFQLITEKDELKESGTTNKGKSQTKFVSAYELNETRLRYRLTIVDTPGFGDTEGIERDKTTMDYIRKWFERQDEHGLKTIDAVCIVIKGTETRITEQVKYQLNSVHALFDRDMSSNIITVFTFWDFNTPEALKALSTDGLLQDGTKVFINSIGATKLYESEEDISKIFHKKCWSTFNDFFNTLDNLKPHSIIYALEVLQNRKQLEEEAIRLNDQVAKILSGLEQISEIIKLLESKSTLTQHISFTENGKVVQKSLEEIYTEYGIDRVDQKSAGKLLERLGFDLVQKEKGLSDTVVSIRKILNKLNQIAMRPERATDSQYLQYLIECLPKTSDPQNYIEQRKILQDHLKITKILEAVKSDSPLFNVMESAAAAYLGHTFPDLYRKLRLFGHISAPVNRGRGSYNFGSIEEDEESEQDFEETASIRSDLSSASEVDDDLREIRCLFDQASLSDDSAIGSKPPTPVPRPRLSILKRLGKVFSPVLISEVKLMAF